MTKESLPTVSTSGPIKLGNTTIIGLHPTNILTSPAAPPPPPMTSSIQNTTPTQPLKTEEDEIPAATGETATIPSSKEELSDITLKLDVLVSSIIQPSAPLELTTTDAADSNISSSSILLEQPGPCQNLEEPSQIPSQPIITSSQTLVVSRGNAPTTTVEETDTVSLPTTTSGPTSCIIPPTLVTEMKTAPTAVDTTSSSNIHPVMSLIDRDIVHIVPRIISLLQTHGCMDEYQLISYLPTFSQSFLLKFMKNPPTSGIVEISQRQSQSIMILQDILQVLMALNVVHVEPDNQEEDINPSPLPQDIGKPIIPQELQEPNDTEMKLIPTLPIRKKTRRYFFFDGVPKNEYDVIQPKQVCDLIQQANQEIDHSLERIQLLEEFLLGQDTLKNSSHGTMNKVPMDTSIIQEHDMTEQEKSMAHIESNEEKRDPTQQTKAVREFMRNLLQKYPSIAMDTVYCSALKNFSIDVSDRIKGTMSHYTISTTTSTAEHVGNHGGEKPILKRRGRKRKNPEVTGGPIQSMKTKPDEVSNKGEVSNIK